MQVTIALVVGHCDDAVDASQVLGGVRRTSRGHEAAGIGHHLFERLRDVIADGLRAAVGVANAEPRACPTGSMSNRAPQSMQVLGPCESVKKFFRESAPAGQWTEKK